MSLEVEAHDVVDALIQARDIVLGSIAGEIQFADIPTDGLLIPPGRRFGRRRV